jgi:autotransporter strand-loop-strand O-heptosyltransferase
LNLEYKELIPKIKNNLPTKLDKKRKYVCISIQSTSQMKYWTDGGWYKTTEYLKKLGYDVLVIDKYESFGISDKMNYIPQNAINETGDISLDYRIQQIKDCEFFIGLSSGLSWLAFALDKKVILISGCTNEDNEFKHNCYRVINKNVCHGCLNDETIDNASDITKSWIYCPRNKKFECSKQISFNMVKEKIDICLSDIKSGEK